MWGCKRRSHNLIRVADDHGRLSTESFAALRVTRQITLTRWKQPSGEKDQGWLVRNLAEIGGAAARWQYR